MKKCIAFILLSAGLFFMPSAVLADDAANQRALGEGIVLFESRHYPEAREIFETLPRNVETLTYLGRIEGETGSPRQAIDLLIEASGLEPENAEIQYWLGTAYYDLSKSAGIFKKLGLVKKWRSHTEASLLLDPSSAPAMFSLGAFFAYAPGMAGGDEKKAMAIAEELRVIDPARHHWLLAEIALDGKDADAAIAHLTESLSLRPDEAGYIELAVIYQGIERWDEAFNALEQGRSSVEHAECLSYQIGRTAALSGERLEYGASEMLRFISHWAHYCSRTDYSTTAFWRLGMIYQHMGKLEDALAVLEKALAIDPRHKESKKALRRVRKKLRRQ